MVLESTVICVDNSDYMRNGDFIPTRLQAQSDVVNMLCHAKRRVNPENTVALMTMASKEVLVTLTTDVSRVMARLHAVNYQGSFKFIVSVRIAQLVLMHRQNAHQRTRIVVFVGSPIEGDDEKEMVKLGNRLRKEKVSVDIINFGECEENTAKLETFMNAVNGKKGTGSRLVTVSTGSTLTEALSSSAIVLGEEGAASVTAGGGGFDMLDPDDDPELALALRVSMEEERARQQAERAIQDNADKPMAEVTDMSGSMLRRAISASISDGGNAESGASPEPDLASMSEEEQIAYAMRMSMESTPIPEDTPMSGGTTMYSTEVKGEDEDMNDILQDPQFLTSVLQSLPGVDAESVAANTKKEKDNDDEN